MRQLGRPIRSLTEQARKFPARRKVQEILFLHAASLAAEPGLPKSFARASFASTTTTTPYGGLRFSASYRGQ